MAEVLNSVLSGGRKPAVQECAVRCFDALGEVFDPFDLADFSAITSRFAHFSCLHFDLAQPPRASALLAMVCLPSELGAQRIGLDGGRQEPCAVRSPSTVCAT